ncbi:LytTR family DNA-binding domain-containing protein [Olivibacter sp. CPCC 100613]|uniref:LytR/AlgR family response regulator transcription factor n=1 Tax=Olivibacter sp. CPCC 100613 TaxID=3079931 RepID=UPI002FF4514A
MKIHCFIIDDEEHAIDLLKHHIEKVPFLELVGTSTDPVNALSIIHSKSIDLLFLDVQMPYLTGIEFLKVLNRNIRVILTTAYTEYAIAGYEFAVVDYLLKPISFDRFLQAVNKIQNDREAHEDVAELLNNPYMFIKTDRKGKLMKVDVNKIVFVEGLKNYVSIYIDGGERIIAFVTMKEMENQLSQHAFMRIHKSYIIALNYVHSIEGNQVRLVSYPQRSIPIGNIFKDAFSAWLDKKTLSR